MRSLRHINHRPPSFVLELLLREKGKDIYQFKTADEHDHVARFTIVVIDKLVKGINLTAALPESVITDALHFIGKNERARLSYDEIDEDLRFNASAPPANAAAVYAPTR
jgi:hypothetical protein